MDTKRILRKAMEEEQEERKKFGIGMKTAHYLLTMSPELRNQAIIVAKRNGTTLARYLRKCIEELVEQHQDNDQPRIEAWSANSPIKSWPIPQLDVKPSRFKGWSKKEIQEYEDAIHNTLRSLEQARLAILMQDKNYYDAGGENKEE